MLQLGLRRLPSITTLRQRSGYATERALEEQGRQLRVIYSDVPHGPGNTHPLSLRDSQ